MARILVVGRSGTGKTTLVIRMALEAMQKFGKQLELIVVSPTFGKQEMFRPLDQAVVYHASIINSEVARNIYHHVDENWSKSGQKKKKIWVIIDDMGESTFIKLCKKDNSLLNLITEARQLDLVMFDLVQRFTQAPTAFRSNAEMGIFFKIESERELRQVWDEFAAELEFETFKKLCDQVWKEPYSYVKICRKDPHNKLYFDCDKHIKGVHFH